MLTPRVTGEIRKRRQIVEELDHVPDKVQKVEFSCNGISTGANTNTFRCPCSEETDQLKEVIRKQRTVFIQVRGKVGARCLTKSRRRM